MATLAATFLLAATHIHAATYYVSTTGNDGNTGTSASPYRNIQFAINGANSGDVINVLPGTYERIDSGNKNITIQSTGGRNVTFIEGNSSFRPATLGTINTHRDTKLIGFTLRGGNITANGGGVYGGTLTNCRINNNKTTGYGGGAYFSTIHNSIINGNTASFDGGGAYYCTLNNCQIYSNKARFGGGAYGGTLNNCEVDLNEAGSGGGAEAATLTNCTVTKNKATTSTLGGGGMWGGSAYNCIVWDNTSSYSGTTRDNYYNTEFYWSCSTPAAPGLITSDPRFVNPGSYNYRLQSNSPCINAGWNGYATSAGITKDKDDNPRFIGAVDMGCFEYQTPPAPTGVTAGTDQAAYVKVSWNAVAGATGYKIYRRDSLSSAYTLLNTTTALTYNSTSGTAGTWYLYYVTAVNGTLEGTYSAYALGRKSAPATATGLTASSDSISTVTLRWTATAGATGYKIYRSTGSTIPTSVYATITSGTTVTYNDSYATPAGTWYYYWVKATNAAGDGPASASARGVMTANVTVSFNRNYTTGGLEIIIPNQTKQLGHPYGSLPNPTRTGYTFKGWFNSTALTTEVLSTTTVNNPSAHTLFAKWEVNTYRLTLQGNGGTWPSIIPLGRPRTFVNQTVTFNTNYAPSSWTAPTRVGYTFAGWYTAETGGSAVTSSMLVTTAANHEFYARWTGVPVVVTLDDAMGGSTSRNVTFGSPYGTALHTPTRTGYTFMGWYTLSGGGGYKIETSTNVNNANAHQLTAHWVLATVPTFTVGINATPSAGGTFTGNGTFAGGSHTVEAIPNTGYRFVNWTEGAIPPVTTNPWTFSLAMNRNLVANFAANTYVVVYNGNGNTGGSTADSTHTYGTGKALTANGFTKTGYVFAGWAETATGAVEYSNEESVLNLSSTQNATINLFAVWTLSSATTHTVTLSANPVAGGTFTGAGTFETGPHTVVATPSTGYQFVNWTSPSSIPYSSTASWEFVLGADITAIANFAPITYTVAYNGNTATSGSTASSSHIYGVLNLLTANGFVKTGHTFAGWAETASGAVEFADGDEVQNLSSTDGATVNLYAVWTPDAVVTDYTLTLSASPAAGGSVSGGGTFPEGELRTVEATANAGYTFIKWTEGAADVSGAAVYTFPLTADRSLVAVFMAGAPLAPADLNASTTFTTHIALTWLASDGATGYKVFRGTVDNPAVAELLHEGDETSFNDTTAVPSTDYYYWVKAVNTLGDSGFSTTAAGMRVPGAADYTITLSHEPGAGGSTAGGGTFPAGSSQTVTATVNAGYTFVSWTDDGKVVSITPSYTFTLTENVALRANFAVASATYTVTLGASPAAGGSVSGNGTFAADSLQTVTAVANAGYTFVKWTEGGLEVSATPAYTFTLSANRNLVANFAEVADKYTITLTRSPNAGGSVTGNGEFDAGTPRTVTATANANYTFVNWTEGGVVVSAAASYSFVLNANRNLVANFASDGGKPDPLLEDPTNLPQDAMTSVARVYDGFVYEANNTVRGTLSLTAKPNLKTGVWTLTAKVLLQTATVSFSKPTGSMAEGFVFLAKTGERLEVQLLDNTFSGTLTGGRAGTLNAAGARNKFADKKTFPAEQTVLNSMRGQYNTALLNAADVYQGYITMSVGNLGAVKIAGVLADGAKVSGTAKLLKGLNNNGLYCVALHRPLYSKAGFIGGLLWVEPVVAGKAAVFVDTEWEWYVEWQKKGFLATTPLDVLGGYYGNGKTGPLIANRVLKFSAEIPEMGPPLPGLAGAWATAGFPRDLPVNVSGTKIFLDKDKAPKKGVAGWDYEAGPNPSTATLSYTAKTGLFKGGFKLYFDSPDGAVHRAVSVAYSGVLIPDGGKLLGLGSGSTTVNKVKILGIPIIIE